jgi:hypothetical protein
VAAGCLSAGTAQNGFGETGTQEFFAKPDIGFRDVADIVRDCRSLWAKYWCVKKQRQCAIFSTFHHFKLCVERFISRIFNGPRMPDTRLTIFLRARRVAKLVPD